MALDYQDNNNNKAFTKNKNSEVVGGNFSSSSNSYGSEDNCNTNSHHRSINRHKLEEILPPSTANISFEQGLDYILSHFDEPIWPRTIFTKTLGKQHIAYNKQEALARFKQSNLLDCRINAYPHYVGFNGINRQPPNLIFIDIDRCTFKTDKEFWLAVEKTYRNINDILGGAKPTSIWTGNGIHIYQPVQAVVLEQESLFAKFDQPSQTFLKFAAQYLSHHKSDTNNNPAFRSCLLRIPGSHNSKCVQENNGIADSSTEIRIIQRWDGFRPKINPLLYQFYIYLADAKIKEINSLQQIQRKKERYYNTNNGVIQNSNTIMWIEKLLQTPIDDYRKNAVSLILAPYLINIKKLSYDDALNVINSWLDKCRQVRRLDYDLSSITKYMLKESIRNGRRPLKFETLKLKNKILYEILR